MVAVRFVTTQEFIDKYPLVEGELTITPHDIDKPIVYLNSLDDFIEEKQNGKAND